MQCCVVALFVCGHRPKTKEFLELLFLLLSFTIWFISSLKEILVKKSLPDWEFNRGPSDPQPSTYPLSYRATDIIYVKIDFRS